MAGPATHAELTELWRTFKDALMARLQCGPKLPSAELLACCRKFLRDSAQPVPSDEATQKDLERLQRLYLQRLVEALAQPNPSAAVLAEARQFSTRHSAGGGRTSPTPTAEGLDALDMPFKTTQ